MDCIKNWYMVKAALYLMTPKWRESKWMNTGAAIDTTRAAVDRVTAAMDIPGAAMVC